MPSPPEGTVRLQEQARALGDPTRHAIFRHIAASEEPIGVADLNEHFPFNHNAIRQHLAKLVAAGLVTERRAATGGRGRPRLLYELSPAVEGQWGTTGPYERLSRMLVEIIRSGRPAEEVGRRCAPLFAPPSPTGDGAADISAAMERQGFEPEVRTTRRGTEVVLHRCPFAAAATADRPTVCSLHLGIAEGLAAGSDVGVEELVGYDPRRAGCRIRLRGVDAGGATAGSLTLRVRAPAPARSRT
jgi:predicted ArsR family transcriptional regulator